MAAPIITLRGQDQQLIFSTQDSCLLDTLERHQLDVEYQCRSGYCGACQLNLLQGEVCYQETPLAFIPNGTILPCCCIPITDLELER